MKPLQHNHWAAQPERGNRLFLALTTLMVRHLPAWLLNPSIALIVCYFYATAPRARRHIRRYQARLRAAYPAAKLPRMAAFRQFTAFGAAICDRFAVWQRKIRYEDLIIEDPDNVYALVQQRGRGQIFACSHIGNTEVCRALVSHNQGFKLNVLVHSQHAQAFNEALHKAGAARIQLIQVTDLDAALMLELNRRIDAGEWLAIAADRVPVRGEKTVAVHFLGHTAELPRMATRRPAQNPNQHPVLHQTKRTLSFKIAPLRRHRQLDAQQPPRPSRRHRATICRHHGARMRRQPAAMV